ncbi:MAG: ribonuclease H family protein [Microthrixaceae bacterium]
MADLEPVVVYTDGACRGNPGPGGWAWAEPGGAWASGHDPDTTNQRMEITAALEAAEAHPGALVIVSDSTYVVHCWRDRWWEGWLRRGWRNAKKDPVANRDLWERLVPHFRDRADLELRWVKGHGGDPMNDVVDRLAVRASHAGHGAAGATPPAEDQLGPPDRPGRATATATAPTATTTAPTITPRDGRVPPGRPVAVVGVRDRALAGSPRGATATRRLTEVLAAQRELAPDLVVLTGLRPGAEELAARAALAAGVPYVAVLPYPDPVGGRPAAERRAFDESVAGADGVVVLERRRPPDPEGRRAALARRDGWLRANAAAAVVLTDGDDPEAELLLRRFEEALGEEVWVLDL